MVDAFMVLLGSFRMNRVIELHVCCFLCFQVLLGMWIVLNGQTTQIQ